MKLWNMDLWNDFLIETDEYIGLIIDIDNVRLYFLTQNAHPWLKKFGDFYVGFQKGKT